MNQDHTAALHATIAAVQAQRGALGDALADAALAPLLQRLASGGSQPPGDAAIRRLRQVSVLFLDIVGSTQLIEHLDPEDVQALVDGALVAFTDLVHQHGGEVLRYAGDSLKAAFGADHTREDDAERAVLCGLAMLQEAQRQGVTVQQVHGQAGFGARVGIHTGPVVRGGGVEQGNSLSGLAVHIAARMEQAAPAGALRISIETFRLVQGRFDVLAQPLLAVKGLQAPMRTFLVQGVRERRLRGLRHGADGVTTELVGRADELARLQGAAAEVCAPGGRLAAATVVGEAGLGKSRLLAELQAAMPASVQTGGLWRASSHPQAQYQPYGLLRDLLFWQLGVRDSDSQAQAQHTFASALRPVFGAAADEQTALLGQLIGLDYSASPHVAGILRDGKQLQGRGLFAWVRYLQLQAAAQPLVLVLDDLQWADDASLDALDHLVAQAADLPVLLLCAARPELLQRRPQWAAAWPRHALVPLQPLTETGRSALAGALLTRFAAPVPLLHARLAAQAAGNPFYMEALLQMLVDTGVIDTRGDHWQVQDGQLQHLAVPPTLVGVLQATLDALDDADRRSLQQASVVGVQFWDDALAAIDPQAPDHLPALSRRELALPQARSAFDGVREYSFRHHLLHQVTYGTVLKPDKRAAHGHAARWLQGRSAGRENELASQIAEHFEQAGDVAQAITCWLRAAEDASRRQADVAALAHADRALALDDGSDLQRQVRLHRVRAAVFMRAGNSAGHGQALEALEALADRLDDDVLRLALFNDRGWRLFMEARFEEAVELAERRLARAEHRAPQEAGRAHNVTSICLSRLGRHDEARAHAVRGLAQARAAGDLNTEAAILTNMGLGDMEANRVSQALAVYAQALAAYEAAGSRVGIANVQLNLAQLEISLGRMHHAQDLLTKAVQTCQEIGSGRIEAMARANHGVVLVELGQHQEAYDTALEALRLARISGEHRTEGWAHHSAQQAAAGLGRFADALAHAQAAVVQFAAHNDPNTARIDASAAIRHLHALGRHADALAAADALLTEIGAQGGWGEGADAVFEPAYNLFCVLQALGDGRAAGLLDIAFRGLCAQADHMAVHVPRDAFMHSTVLTRSLSAAWAAAGAGQLARST